MAQKEQKSNPQKAAEPEFKFPDAFDVPADGVLSAEMDIAYKDFIKRGLDFRKVLTEETDRGCALFAASYLEESLGKLLERRLLMSDKVQDDLFGQNAPLGSFSSKIKMAYYMGLISSKSRRDLNIIRQIRNEFAHNSSAISFETNKIKSLAMNIGNTWHPAGSASRNHFTAAVMRLLGFFGYGAAIVKRVQQYPDEPASYANNIEVGKLADEIVFEAMRRVAENPTLDLLEEARAITDKILTDE